MFHMMLLLLLLYNECFTCILLLQINRDVHIVDSRVDGPRCVFSYETNSFMLKWYFQLINHIAQASGSVVYQLVLICTS
jgi:hypothetical protein